MSFVAGGGVLARIQSQRMLRVLGYIGLASKCQRKTLSALSDTIFHGIVLAGVHSLIGF